MKLKILFLFLIICIVINKNKTYAQQNLFNIPSGDITNHKKNFYQHQFNVYKNKLESKAHFVYGLGNGWDAGLNIVGKGFYFSPNWLVLHNDNASKGAVYPIAMATIQKQFAISHDVKINAGAQVGWNLSNKIQNKELNHFTYLITSYHINDGSKIVGGMYNTNQMYVGQGNTLGIMTGYELKLAKKWYIMGDWVSGNNDASVSVLGVMFNASKRIQLCAGWQLPNPNTPKPIGLVLELNLLGWDLY